MAKTGSITITQGTQDVANNQTYITVKGTITTSGDSYRGSSNNGTITVTQDNISIYSGTFAKSAPKNSTTDLFEIGFWVIHKSDGSSGTIDASYDYDGGWCTASTSTTLTDITREFTNTIYHYALGFNGTGNAANGQYFHLGDTTFKKTYDSTFTLTENNAVRIPNGFKLYPTYGTNSVNGTWQSYSYGTNMTQQAKAMSFEYQYGRQSYTIAYDLGGGVNNESNPSTYHVLNGLMLNEPTKEYHTFDGWYISTETTDVVIDANTSNYNYKPFLTGVHPNITYNISIDSARLNSGSATNFATIIYDFTDNQAIAYTTMPFGENVEYSITCPSSANPSHAIWIIAYAGINGSTSGNSVTYEGVQVNYNLGYRNIVFNSENLHFVRGSGIVGGVFTDEGQDKYAATPDLIPIKGGITLRSNMAICGIYTYDANGNFIQRESNYTTIHPISLNAAYMRVELAIVDPPLEEYEANLIIENAVGINVGATPSFTNANDLYNKLDARVASNVTLTAIWIPYKYTITFSGNGGTTTVDSLEVAYETTQNNDIGQYIPQRQAYEFLGWYSSPTGGVQVYDGNGLCTNDGTYWLNDVCVHTEDYTLYAQWKALNIAYYKHEGEWKLCRTYVKVNNTWEPAIMYIKSNNQFIR